MFPSQLAFSACVPLSSRSLMQLRPVCDKPPTTHDALLWRRPARMEASGGGNDNEAVKSTEGASWPPAEMTSEWVEAVERLAIAASLKSPQSADLALQQADGDEKEALRLLMDQNWSDIRRNREETVARERAAGNLKRVSALKEAEMRRKATGSARGFFKGYIENVGTYVDSGYVDDSADTMGKIIGGLKKLFGGGKSK